MPSSDRTCSWGMLLFCFDHACASPSAFSSSAERGSSSMGALAMARETGSSMASSSPTTAESCVGGSWSISSWACSLVEGIVSPSCTIVTQFRAIILADQRRAAHALEVFDATAEVCEDLFVRNALIVLQPLDGCGNRAGFLYADRFVVVRGVGVGAGQRIEHDFEQRDHGGDLIRSHEFDQRVSLLLLLRGSVGHISKSTESNREALDEGKPSA